MGFRVWEALAEPVAAEEKVDASEETESISAECPTVDAPTLAFGDVALLPLSRLITRSTDASLCPKLPFKRYCP